MTNIQLKLATTCSVKCFSELESRLSIRSVLCTVNSRRDPCRMYTAVENGCKKELQICSMDESCQSGLKSIHGVFDTSLNKENVWIPLGLQIVQIIKARKPDVSLTSVDPARFYTHPADEGGKGSLGPVVIWVGVKPGTTPSETAHEVSLEILDLLKDEGIEGVVIEWRESVLQRLAGPPPLARRYQVRCYSPRSPLPHPSSRRFTCCRRHGEGGRPRHAYALFPRKSRQRRQPQHQGLWRHELPCSPKEPDCRLRA
jgi:hypothetical protein